MSTTSRKQKQKKFYHNEKAWFSRPFAIPDTRCGINVDLIKAFQDLIWENPHDKILSTFGKK